jgi:hypothetical protein
MKFHWYSYAGCKDRALPLQSPPETETTEQLVSVECTNGALLLHLDFERGLVF